jgi:hypothetical protein
MRIDNGEPAMQFVFGHNFAEDESMQDLLERLEHKTSLRDVDDPNKKLEPVRLVAS